MNPLPHPGERRHPRAVATSSAVLLVLLLAAAGLAVRPPQASVAAPAFQGCPAWAATNTPNNGALNNVLYGVAASSANNAWAVGYTSTGNGAERVPLAMRWNGAEWAMVPGPTPGATTNYFNAVEVISANDVWALMETGPETAPVPYIVHWDGSAWTTATLPTLDPSGNSLYAIQALAPNDVWAVGSIGCSKCKTEHSLVLHYDGVDWRPVALPVPGYADALFSVFARGPNDVWFAGYRVTGDGAQGLIMHWDGREVTAQDAPIQIRKNVLLYAIVASGPNDAWAFGTRASRDVSGAVTEPVIYKLQGGYWVQSEISAPGPEGGALLWADARAPNDILAAGYFIASATRRAWLLHYDGNNWTQPAYADPGAGAILYGVSMTADGAAFAAGRIESGGALRTLALRYSDPCAPPPAAPTNTPVPATATPTRIPTFAPTPIPGETTRMFPETGKTVRGLFLDYWQSNGGLAQQGFPISDMFTEISALNGKPYTVQYFERAVFEYHPENQAPYNVLLSQLGTFQYKKKYPTGASGQTPNTSEGSLLFPETGKRVGGKFLEYWQKNGGLAQQGYPISDEFMEKSDLNGQTYLVQYFERAVFELHPENQPPFDVLLSQLGTFQYRGKYPAR